jgi:hypothetical protein
VSGDADTLSLYTGIDADGDAELVTYSIDANELIETVSDLVCTTSCTPQTPLIRSIISGVQNQALEGSGAGTDLFTYYGSDPVSGTITALGDPPSIPDAQYIEIHMVVDLDPDRSPTCETLEIGVTLRNWHD